MQSYRPRGAPPTSSRRLYLQTISLKSAPLKRRRTCNAILVGSPNRKQPTNIKNERTECARRQSASDQYEQDCGIHPVESMPTDEVGHGSRPWQSLLPPRHPQALSVMPESPNRHLAPQQRCVARAMRLCRYGVPPGRATNATERKRCESGTGDRRCKGYRSRPVAAYQS